MTLHDAPSSTDLARQPRSADAVLIHGVPVLLEGRDATARRYLDLVYDRRGIANPGARPVLATSMNGHTIYEVGRNEKVHALFSRFKLTSMDGQPAVIISRLWPGPFAERVATTDLVHDVIRAGLPNKVRHFFLGASKDVVERAAARLRGQYPGIEIVGAHHGYFNDDDLPKLAREIDAAAPEILWVCMGVPREQEVALALGDLLSSPALIKTGGGLLDFLSGANKRAPRWMQAAGLEWLFRLVLEPRRLFLRYLISNPVALLALLRAKPRYKQISF